LGFTADTKEMTVRTLHPGVTPEQVVENTGFDLASSPPWAETPAPSPDELEALRQVVDPDGVLRVGD